MPNISNGLYEFGPFRVDPFQRVLLRAGTPVRLPPKTFEVLLALVESGGRILTKEDLLTSVWPDTVVEEANLSHHVFALRRALGDDGHDGKFIETIPKRGYRFIQQVQEVPDENPARSDVESHRLPQTRLMAIAAVLAGAMSIAGYAGFRWTTSGATPPAIHSLAILPFEPLAADPRDEPLGLGLADTLITRLAAVRKISIRPISAVRRYGRPERDPIQAGRELHADAVLDGSMQRAADRIRVTVRLCRVADGASLWAGTFDEELADILTIQDAIAARVAGALSLTLTRDERFRLAKHETESPQAYQLYLLGRYFSQHRTPDGFRQSEKYLREAVRVDPKYALAYAALSDTWSARAMFRDLPASEGATRAREAADSALKIDPTLPEAHIALGIVLDRYDLDHRSAEREYLRALELDPSNAAAHHRYAMFLVPRRRPSDATAHFERAMALDPTSVIIALDAGRPFYSSRDYTRAEQQFRNALQMDPHYHRTHALLAHCYTQMGRFDAAMSEALTAVGLEGSNGQKYQLVYIQAKAGRIQEARKLFTHLEGSVELQKGEPYFRPLALSALGDTDRAFSLLGKMYENRSPELFGLNSDPAWDILGDDARFKALLNRIGYTAK